MIQIKLLYLGTELREEGHEVSHGLNISFVHLLIELNGVELVTLSITRAGPRAVRKVRLHQAFKNWEPLKVAMLTGLSTYKCQQILVRTTI